MNNSFDNIQSDELTNEQGQFEEALQELNGGLIVDGQKMPFTIESADDIIERIAHVLSEADGEFIEKIANQVLARNVKYQGDSLFRISTKNNSTL
jgi:hypothetical protein